MYACIYSVSNSVWCLCSVKCKSTFLVVMVTEIQLCNKQWKIVLERQRHAGRERAAHLCQLFCEVSKSNVIIQMCWLRARSHRQLPRTGLTLTSSGSVPGAFLFKHCKKKRPLEKSRKLTMNTTDPAHLTECYFLGDCVTYKVGWDILTVMLIYLSIQLY